MNEIQYKVLRTIANVTPVPQKQITAIFKLYHESIDKTIHCVVLAASRAVDPLSLAKDDSIAREKQAREMRERAKRRCTIKRFFLNIGYFFIEMGE